MYDISLLCESKLDKADEDYILSVITPLSLNAYFKHRKTLSARRSGGLCILYKEHLDMYITHIVTKCKLIQWLRISKQLTGADKDNIIGNTYIPPEGTRYQNFTPFQELQAEIQKFNNCSVCIVGDLNSHTNINRDYVEATDLMPEQLNFDVEMQNHLNSVKMIHSHNIRLCRSNTDLRKPNSHGTHLIEFCKSNNMFICNGRLNSDMSGKATTLDGSVIDYLIASPVILCKIENFLVHDFDAIFSDIHCRVSWSIKCINLPNNLNKSVDTSNVISVKKTHRNMWVHEKAIEFANQLNVNDINDIKTKLSNSETHIDCILSDVQTLFKGAADNTLGEEYEYELDTSKKYKPIKFDRQTLNLRNRYCNARKFNSGVSGASKAYKKAVAKAKAVNRNQLIKKLSKSWKKNSKYYWSTFRR